MKHLFLALLAVLAFAAAAEAQTVQVDINRATLLWTWTADPDSGPVDEFRLKCGNQSGNYTKITSIAGTARELAVKSAITGQGNWFCAVTAANAIGESGASNEVNFAAAAGPAGKIGLQLKAN